MVILAEGDFEWYRENQVDFAVPTDPHCVETTQPGKTWLAQNALGADRSSPPYYLGVLSSHQFCLITEVQKAQFSRGSDVVQGQQLVDHGLWDHPGIDPESCGAISTFTPVGPWPQSASSSP